MKIRTATLLLSLFGLLFYLNSSISSSFIILFVMAFICGLLYKFESKLYFVIAFIFLLSNPLLIFLHQTVLVEKIAKVTYLFVFLGLGFELIEKYRPSFFSRGIKNSALIAIDDLIDLIFLIKKHVWQNIYKLAKLFYKILFLITKRLMVYRFFFDLIHRFLSSSLVLNWRKSIVIISSSIYIIFLYTKEYFFFQTYFIFDHLVAFIQNFLIFQIMIVLAVIIFIKFFIKKYGSNNSIWLVGFSFYLIFLQVSGNTLNSYIAEHPYITKIKPAEASMWSHITIYGQNFGNAQYNDSQVIIGEMNQRVILWTDKKIVVVVDAIKTPTGFLWVKNVDQKVSNKVRFKYIPI